MRKSYHAIIALFGSIGLLACSQNIEREEHFFLRAYFADQTETKTKTSLSSDGLSVLWTPMDKIRVFSPEDNPSAYTFVSTNTIPAEDTFFESETMPAGMELWAVYPWAEDNVFDGNTLTIRIPGTQLAVPDGVSDGMLPMAAVSDHGEPLAFRNICGGVKFRVTQEGITRATLRGRRGEDLAGLANVHFAGDGAPEVLSLEYKSDSVVLAASSGETFQAGRWYYIVCAPVELQEGFTLTFEADGSKGVYSHQGRVTVHRAVWGRLTDVDKGISFMPVEASASAPAPNEIWYTSVSGSEIRPSFPDSFDAGLVSNAVKEGKGVLRFDRPLTTFPSGAFADNSDLVSVILPDNIVSIGNGAFQNCTSLKVAHLPASLKSIGRSAFYGCVALSDIEFPEGLELIDYQAFCLCSSLEGDLVFPSSLKALGGWAFYGCEDVLGDPQNHSGRKRNIVFKSLIPPVVGSRVFYINDSSLATFINYIYVPEGCVQAYKHAEGWSEYAKNIYDPDDPNTMVKYRTSDGPPASINTESFPEGWLLSHKLEDGVWTVRFKGVVSRLGLFNGCRNLTWVEIPSSVWILDDYCFGDCVSLKEIDIPEGVQYLSFYCFRGCSSLKNVVLPTSLSVILSWSFEDCSSLEEITLPENLTVMGSYVFSGCTALKEITMLAPTPPQISADTFSFSDSQEWWILIPEEYMDAYMADEAWAALSGHFKPLSL